MASERSCGRRSRSRSPRAAMSWRYSRIQSHTLPMTRAPSLLVPRSLPPGPQLGLGLVADPFDRLVGRLAQFDGQGPEVLVELVALVVVEDDVGQAGAVKDDVGVQPGGGVPLREVFQTDEQRLELLRLLLGGDAEVAVLQGAVHAA